MWRHRIKQSFYNPTCLSCGSLMVKEHLFCDICFSKKIEPRLEFKKDRTRNLDEVYSLIEWKPDESDIVSELVYRLKNGKCTSALQYFSTLAAQAMRFELPNKNFDLIVPIPGSSLSSVHSLFMAKFLGDFYGVPVFDLLEKIDPKAQKTRSAQQRRHLKMQQREQFTKKVSKDYLKDAAILVVDDIVTTGNSFIQAQTALQNIKNTTLLTLFHRPEKSKTPLVS